MLDPGKKQHFPTTYNTYRSSREFGAERKLISDDDSGICSPPLWGTISPPRSPQHYYRILSPTSRAQVIARGQKELMEMVSKMPEGCYELSLRDIVEQSATVASDPAKGDGSFAEDSFTDETSIMKNQREREKKKKKVQQMSRSGSMDHNHNGGFLLKMVFPVSFGSSKKKTMTTTKTKAKNNNDNNISNSNSGSGRVSPRPLLVDGYVKSGENEWWKNRFVQAEESESGGLSSNSGSSKSTGSSASTNSSGRNNNNASSHGGGGCWAFILWKRTKKAKEKGG